MKSSLPHGATLVPARSEAASSAQAGGDSWLSLDLPGAFPRLGCKRPSLGPQGSRDTGRGEEDGEAVARASFWRSRPGMEVSRGRSESFPVAPERRRQASPTPFLLPSPASQPLCPLPPAFPSLLPPLSSPSPLAPGSPSPSRPPSAPAIPSLPPPLSPLLHPAAKRSTTKLTTSAVPLMKSPYLRVASASCLINANFPETPPPPSSWAL